jgi:2-polyprenyl-3-methyl-5-hydroxy-6-metoxy-1,4-benzoquinol methylase
MAAYAHANLVRCTRCGLTFSGRRPTDAELDAHYRDYGHAWQDSGITRVRYRALLESFEPYRQTGRLLDVGCGAGFFLDEAVEKGWQVFGTEFSERALALARAKGHEVISAQVAGEVLEQGSFDVVTAFEVFEHVRDPLDEASLIATVTRPGGLLYCTTPNFDALSRRALGARWSVIEYPEHLWYFTPRTLRRWLGRAGFEAVSIGSSGISLARMRAAVQRDGGAEPADPRADERLRTTIERRPLLRLGKTWANGALSLTGLGDTLKARFRRATL